MTNLLYETLVELNMHDKSPDDVLWVGADKATGTWDEFASLANFDYDNGYGLAEVRTSLIIVGTDWWIERAEYDGSEWSSLNTPKAPGGERSAHSSHDKGVKMTKETYLGDGLYASFDGFMIILRTPREHGDHWIGLEPQVLAAFERFVRDLKNGVIK